MKHFVISQFYPYPLGLNSNDCPSGNGTALKNSTKTNQNNENKTQWACLTTLYLNDSEGIHNI